MKTGTEIINELTFRCYAYNRQISPSISPERWSVLFGKDETAAMEARFQEWIANGGK